MWFDDRRICRILRQRGYSGLAKLGTPQNYSIQENHMNRLFGSSNNHDNGIEWRPSSTSSKSASSNTNTIKTKTTNPNPRASSTSEPAQGGTHQAQGSASINSSAAVPSSVPRRTRLSFELHPSKLYLDDLGQITILP